MSNRFVLCDEIKTCVWGSPEEMPEVDISIAYQIDTYSTQESAEIAGRHLLEKVGAKPTWADVRPIEECAKCSCDFDTREPHHTLSLTEEAGDESNPEILGGWYMARLCRGCADVARRWL